MFSKYLGAALSRRQLWVRTPMNFLPFGSSAMQPSERALRFLDELMMTGTISLCETIVDLPVEQMRRLALLCRKEKISRAEAVRRAVEQLLRNSSVGDVQAYFGASKTSGNVSRQVMRLRAQWKERA